jgi:hypothetical protein
MRGLVENWLSHGAAEVRGEREGRGEREERGE